MAVSPADLTDDQLDAYITARLAIAGVDVSLFPTSPDPVSGSPTRDTVYASLRGFLRATPSAINTWRPTADNPALSQQTFPPLEYPSITQAWTR